MNSSSHHIRNSMLAVLIFLLSVLGFSFLVIRGFGAFHFKTESVMFEFVNYFWNENFHFWKLPHFINWHSDYFLYPFGIDITFMPWAFEMNLWGMLFDRIFGPGGPWGQSYYLFSLAVTFFVSYGLIAKRKGNFWGILFAFALTFCNYAAICKFPGHFTHCIVHWGILSVLLDAIIVEKYWNGEKFSALFVQGKILLLLLALGLEMGYIAGFACCSFFVTACYLLLVQAVRDRSPRKTWNWICGIFREIFSSYRSSKWNILLSFLIVLTAWVYIPTILQIAVNASQTGKTALMESSPLRIFLPIFPGYNPATVLYSYSSKAFYAVDTIYAFNAGWTFLIVFLFGAVMRFRENFKKWLPFVLLMLAVLLMNYCPVITLFPAFKCSRLPERFSPYLILLLLIPLYFLAADKVSFGGIRKQRKLLWFVIPLAALFVLELTTAYRSTFLWSKADAPVSYPPAYRKAFELVRALPGDAVFFYPFYIPGSVVLPDRDVPMSNLIQFAALARKKLNGVYFGRMFESLLTDFRNSKFPEDLLRLDQNAPHILMQHYFLPLFRKTDFAAVILCTDELSPALVAEFHKNLPPPIHTFTINAADRRQRYQYEIIPLPENLRGRKKPDVKKLTAFLAQKYEFALDRIFREIPSGQKPRFISFGRHNANITTDGIGGIEPWGRWIVDKNAELRIAYPADFDRNRLMGRLTFSILLSNKGSQEITLFVNGKQVARRSFSKNVQGCADFAQYSIDFRFPPTDGKSFLTMKIEVEEPTSPAERKMSNDPRKLGIGLISFEFMPLSGTRDHDAFFRKIPAEQKTRLIHFGKNNANLMPEGLYDIEPWGRWVSGRHAELHIALPADLGRDKLMGRLTFNILLSKKGTQEVTLSVNGKQAARRSFSKNVQNCADFSQHHIDFRIPPADGRNHLTLKLEVGEPVSPVERKMSNDTRKLGIGLISFEFIPDSTSKNSKNEIAK